MEHVVFYPSAEGQAFKRVSSLDEAIGFVEHLRNSENITEFSVHSLIPVPVSFRAYYHVEVPPAEPVTAPDAPATDAAPALAAAPADDAAPATEPVAAELTEAKSTPESSFDAPAAPELEWVVDTRAAEPVAAAPANGESVETDRSEQWVAEAPVTEPAAESVSAQNVPAASVPAAASADGVGDGPFAEAPPVTPKSSEDVVPVPAGKRSMGFFAR